MSKFANNITDTEYKAIRFAQENGMSDEEINEARLKKGKLPVNFNNFNLAVVESEPGAFGSPEDLDKTTSEKIGDAVTSFGTAAIEEFAAPQFAAAEALGFSENVDALKRLFGAEQAKAPNAAKLGSYADDLFYTVGAGYSLLGPAKSGIAKVAELGAKSKVAQGAGLGAGALVGAKGVEALFGGGSTIANSLAGIFE